MCCFHFDIFIFENKVTGGEMQLDGQFALCQAAVECPEWIRQHFSSCLSIKVDIRCVNIMDTTNPYRGVTLEGPCPHKRTLYGSCPRKRTLGGYCPRKIA